MSASALSGLYDVAGNVVSPHDRPPDVPDLRFWGDPPRLPRGFEARLLGGNWYGSGPMVVIWHPEWQLHVDFPLSLTTKTGPRPIPKAVRVIREERKYSLQAPAPGVSP